jgi:hypothetical protein
VSHHLGDWLRRTHYYKKLTKSGLNLKIEKFESVNGDPLKKFDLTRILTTKAELCQQNTFSYTKAGSALISSQLAQTKGFASMDFGASSDLEILIPLLLC